MEKFIAMFKEILDIEDINITVETNFRELDEWDSLAVLSILAMINEEYDITISREKFEKSQTIEDIFKLINC